MGGSVCADEVLLLVLTWMAVFLWMDTGHRVSVDMGVGVHIGVYVNDNVSIDMGVSLCSRH